MKAFALSALILGMLLLLPLFIVLIKLFGEWLWEAFRKTDYLVDSESPYWAAVLVGVVFLVLGAIMLSSYYDQKDQEVQQENNNVEQRQEAPAAAALPEVQQ